MFSCVNLFSIFRIMHLKSSHTLMLFLYPFCTQINKIFYQWNFIEIDMNFAIYFRQAVLGLHCHSHFTVALLSVRAWQKCTCVTLCNVTCLITRMWSVCFLSDTLIKSVELCQVPVGHIYTYGSFCGSWQSELENCSTETWRNICIMEESMVSVVCLCVHRNRASSLLQGKETKYLM